MSHKEPDRSRDWAHPRRRRVRWAGSFSCTGGVPFRRLISEAGGSFCVQPDQPVGGQASYTSVPAYCGPVWGVAELKMMQGPTPTRRGMRFDSLLAVWTRMY
mgnify:CR=1 FL=1